MTYFLECNRTSFDDIGGIYTIDEKRKLEYLKKSIESGLIPDTERNIYVREGFGALVGFCPSNVQTLEQLLNFKVNDFKRKNPGKPSLKEEVKRIINREESDKFWKEPYYDYKKYVEMGYDLVIGPGCYVDGQEWEKAVYCRNYLEILDNLRPDKEDENKINHK